MSACLAAAIFLVVALGPVGAAGAVEIERAHGEARFTLEDPQVSDLSGITWLGGNNFAAVSDKRKIIHLLTLSIDATTGRITGGRIGDISNVPTKSGDFEGIAWDPAAKVFYISAEGGNSLLRFAPGAAFAPSLPLPAVFAKARPNLSLESLAWNGRARQFWIANEEALKPDGPVSSAAAGTLVRLQKLDPKFRSVAQYAWRTEPAAFRYGQAGSGVSDLCLLPDGQLLVLERGFAGGGLHLRIFLAGFAGATNTSRVPALEGAEIVPATKTLLYEETTGFTNFEGLTLGPKLDGGWQSLIVVADSNGTEVHTFAALKVRWNPVAQPAGRKALPLAVAKKKKATQP